MATPLPPSASGDTPPAEPPKPAEPAKPPADQEIDWKAEAEKRQAEVEKHQALSRKHEARAKENADKAREFDALKRETQTETERAVSDARLEGEKTAAERYRSVIARHALNAAAAQEQKTVPEAAVGRMNLADLVSDDGTVDSEALKEIVSGFAPLAGAKPAGPPPDPAQRGHRSRGQGGKQNPDDLLAAGADLYRSTFPKN
jgi:hypothetical protein